MGGRKEDLERNRRASRWEGGERVRIGKRVEKLEDGGLPDEWRGVGWVDGGDWKTNGEQCIGGGSIRWGTGWQTRGLNQG